MADVSHPSPAERFTEDDLYRLPDDELRYEIVGGRLLAEPRPGFRHGDVMAALTQALRAHVVRRRLGKVVAGDTGFILARNPDTVRGPDVAFVSRERLGHGHDPARAFPGPPDLAVEIVSLHDRPDDLHAKVADYLAAGSRLVWVIDPQAREVHVHRSLLARSRL